MTYCRFCLLLILRLSTRRAFNKSCIIFDLFLATVYHSNLSFHTQAWLNTPRFVTEFSFFIHRSQFPRKKMAIMDVLRRFSSHLCQPIRRHFRFLLTRWVIFFDRSIFGRHAQNTKQGPWMYQQWWYSPKVQSPQPSGLYVLDRINFHNDSAETCGVK